MGQIKANKWPHLSPRLQLGNHWSMGSFTQAARATILLATHPKANITGWSGCTQAEAGMPCFGAAAILTLIKLAHWDQRGRITTRLRFRRRSALPRIWKRPNSYWPQKPLGTSSLLQSLTLVLYKAVIKMQRVQLSFSLATSRLSSIMLILEVKAPLFSGPSL